MSTYYTIRCQICGTEVVMRSHAGKYCKKCSKDNARRTQRVTSQKKYIIAERGNRCEKCGCSGELHAHHIKPKSKGGDDSPKNIMLLCATCHRKEHKKHGS